MLTFRLSVFGFAQGDKCPVSLNDMYPVYLSIQHRTGQMDDCVATEPFEKAAETDRLVLTHDNDTVAGVVLHKEIEPIARQEDSRYYINNARRNLLDQS